MYMKADPSIVGHISPWVWKDILKMIMLPSNIKAEIEGRFSPQQEYLKLMEKKVYFTN